MKTFEQLNIKEGILKALTELDYTTPTLVQEKAIPALMGGEDIIILSQTGSGKTFAFGIPTIEHIDPDKKVQQALIVCPTRELATQVSNELKKLTKYLQGIKVFAVYGGQPIFKQIDGLKAKPQIIVGTPGRILDHINRRTLKLESTSMLVLDEADEMLKMGFKEDIEQITQKLAGRRQNVLASATMNNEIKALTQKFLNNPTVINAGGANSPAKTIAQEYVTLTPKHKKQHLLGMLQQFDGTALVFCNTKRMVDDLNKFLNEQNIPSRALHGDMRQSERTRVMNAFKSEKVNILVATDVAARGIDVNNITYVINYDYPEMEEYYIHRIGRTGRAGKQGKAYTFITTNLQMQNLMQLSKKIDFTITKSELSEAVEFKKGQQNKPRTRFNQRGATNNQNKKQSGSSKQYSKNNKDAKNSKNSSYNKDTKKSNKTSYNKDSKNSPYSKKEQTKTTSKQKNKTQSFSKSKKEQRKETPQTKQNQTTGFEKFMKKNKKKR